MRVRGSLPRTITYWVTFELGEIPQLPRGVPKIEVTFNIDANGILSVTAIEQSTGKSAEVTINRESGRLTQEEISKMIEEAEIYKGEDELRKQALDTKNSFEKYLYSVQASVNDTSVNDNLSEEEISHVNKYLLEMFAWLSVSEDGKDVLDQARQQVEYTLKPFLYKIYSRSEQQRVSTVNTTDDTTNADNTTNTTNATNTTNTGIVLEKSKSAEESEKKPDVGVNKPMKPTKPTKVIKPVKIDHKKPLNPVQIQSVVDEMFPEDVKNTPIKAQTDTSIVTLGNTMPVVSSTVSIATNKHTDNLPVKSDKN